MISASRLVTVVSVAGVLVACRAGTPGSADAGPVGAEHDAGRASTPGSPGSHEGPAAGELDAAPGHLNADVPHKRAGSRCGGSEVPILLAPGEEGCVIECRSHAACPAGWTCDGEGVLSSGGKPGGHIQFCTAAARREEHDGGPAPAAPTATAPTPIDAGKATPAPEPKRLDVKPTHGACPAGYKTCGAICRLACGKDADCGLATARCQAGFCLGPGALPCK